MKAYVAELLTIYRKYPCMYSIDNSWEGFEWLNADDADRSVYSFFRKRRDGQEQYHVRDQYDPHDVGELYDRCTEEKEIQTAAEQ